MTARMAWVDTHCHLQLDDRPADELLARATDVDWLVVPGVDVESSLAARALSAEHGGRLRWSAGVHPHDASRWEQQRDAIESLAIAADAVGETGLDYYRNLSTPEAQKAAFGDHIRLAVEHHKPLIIHCRDAFADVYELLAAADLAERAVLHCWTGGPRWTRRFRELGVTFSFAGPVAFTTGETVRLGAAEVDPATALVETDTPYLAPPPHRSQPNEPQWVELVGAALAHVWGLASDEVARLTARRAVAVFGDPR